MEEDLATVLGHQGKKLRILESLINDDSNESDEMDPMFFDDTPDALAALTARKMWESSAFMILQFAKWGSKYFEGKRILELGSGTGVVGLVAASYGAKQLILSDMDAVVNQDPILTSNMNRNADVLRDCQVDCMAIDWIEVLKGRQDLSKLNTCVDVIVASDCVWLNNIVEPFVCTIDCVLKGNPGCVAIVAFMDRSTATSTVFASASHVRETFKAYECCVIDHQNGVHDGANDDAFELYFVHKA